MHFGMDAIGKRVDILAHRIGTLSPCIGVFGLPIDALDRAFLSALVSRVGA